MKGVEKIFKGRKLISVILRHETKITNLRFFTSDYDPIQIGVHNYKKKRESKIHFHKVASPILISKIHKFIYVESGRLEVVLITEEGKDIKTVLLRKGDSIIIKEVAHKVNFFAGTKAFEIKQGPYIGELRK